MTIPQKPATIPPAETAKITSSGWSEFVLPYTFGPITLPSKIGQMIQMMTVSKNILVLITEDTSNERTATMNPPNHGIMADTPDNSPKIR